MAVVSTDPKSRNMICSNYKELVKQPNENDVLCGRGSSTYMHPGNKQFRSIVAKNKKTYNKSENSIKPIIAKGIVSFIRTRDPPGRYLTHDKESDNWFEISHFAAIQKTQQALREKTKWVKNDSKIATLELTQNNEEKEDEKRPENQPPKLKTVEEISNTTLRSFPKSSTAAVKKTSTIKNDGTSIELENALVRTNSFIPHSNLHLLNDSAEDDIDNLIAETFNSSPMKFIRNLIESNERPEVEMAKDIDCITHRRYKKKKKKLLDCKKIQSIHASFAKDMKKI